MVFVAEALGQVAMDAVIAGSMVRCSHAGEDDGIVYVWKGNTAEQLGQAIVNALAADPGYRSFLAAVRKARHELLVDDSRTNASAVYRLLNEALKCYEKE